MITLYFKNSNIFCYNVEDWLTLRKTHRIIGEIIGNSSHIPSLPLKLSPEEAILLMKKNIAEVREILDYSLNNIDMEEFEKKMLENQIQDYRNTREVQLKSVMHLIVEQRRKNNDNKSEEEIFEEELSKCSVTKDNMIWPIFLSSDIKKESTRIVKVEEIENLTTPLKSKTFADLNSRGYYITGGAKFGGHFLVYFGDPICHHAIFIVKCVDSVQKISTMELVAFGRLGTSVKKRAVYASIVENEISYITINWIDA